MKSNLVITIGRQFGSGGREIGKILAEMLQLNYYDKELIQEASKASGLCPECFERVDEKAPNRFLNALSKGWLSGASGIPSMGEWSDEMIFKVQSDVIRDIAERHSAVIVGRCADYILRDHPRCISVFIHATTDDCVSRIVARNPGVSESEARELTVKRNKVRAAYYNFYTDKVWGDAASYDLCINSSAIGTQAAAQLIAQFIEQRMITKD
ncbi:MAG: cytidylate kinase-like family protein [Bacteroidaceae bacterium]|nr:cytidylate kinase-like family protein [Bacteroidaceae bacterium]